MSQERQYALRLTAEDVSAERGGEIVLSGIGFTLRQGDSLLVTGPNGSGKSTLLRVIAGLLPPASGTLALDTGTPDGRDIASNCHYLGHLNALKPALSVRENLVFWRDFSGEPALTVIEALEMVGLASVADLPFAYLSTGQRRRIAIARLLVNRRPVWLLDEPTSGLDDASKTRFAALMQGHLDGGGIVVAATHEPLGLGGSSELRLERMH